MIPNHNKPLPLKPPIVIKAPIAIQIQKATLTIAFKPFPIMESTSQKQPRQIERLNFKIQPVTTNASSKDSCCKVQKNGEKNNK